jgi:hypothetical protein
MATMARRLYLVLILLLLVACSVPEEERDYLTVSEVWQRAEWLDGKQVRVRGEPEFQIAVTLAACLPPSCDCNRSRGDLALREGEQRIAISELSLLCQGDECTMECRPFNPRSAEEFEFVGTLRAKGEPNPARLTLEDLDLGSSFQRIGETWVSIETGSFSFEWGEQ